MEVLHKVVKKMNAWDMGLIKLSVAAFVLWIITLWPAAMDWVHSVNTWWFFAVFVIAGARPIYKAYF